jgi:hypothetical protein
MAAIAFERTRNLIAGRLMTGAVPQLPSLHRAGTIPRSFSGLTLRRRAMRLKSEFLDASCFRND